MAVTEVGMKMDEREEQEENAQPAMIFTEVGMEME